jgi:hypothetical protein
MKPKRKTKKERSRLSKPERMRNEIKAPYTTHRVTLKETGDLFYTEHKYPCGYLRNLFTDYEHTEIYGKCALTDKACPYHEFNIKTNDCDIYQNWLRKYIIRGYKE